MKRQQLFITISIIIILLLGALYWSFFRTTEEASGDISETIVSLEAPEGATDNWTVFEIDSSQSMATFTIDEVLRGDDFTVVGTTNQVGGQVAGDPIDPTTVKIGEIIINARTFVTDSDMRDRAIQNRILFTNDYELVRFQPITINGLPDSVAIGDTIEVEIVGDLTIKDVTKSATFATTLTYVSADQIKGSASTTIIYGDYGVEVPLTRSVSSVCDELTMMLNFVAVASQ